MLRFLVRYLPTVLPFYFRYLYVRRFLVLVQVSRHDVLFSEGVGEVFQIVGAPLVQTPLFFYPLHVLVHSRYVDADSPYLVASDFACQPRFF